MSEIPTHRLANGQIDYDHYRRQVRQLRSRSLRMAGRRFGRVVRPLLGAAAVAAALVFVPAGAADCVVCETLQLRSSANR